MPAMTLRLPLLRTIAIAAALGCAAPSAVAQNAGVQELLNRIDRLQREMSTLQQHVYRGAPPPAAAAAAPAPAAAAGSEDPRVAARNSVRITQLENEIRNLTGRLEETDFRLRQIQERLEALVADVDQRLTALEGGTPVQRNGTGPSPNVQIPIARSSGAPVLTPPSPGQSQADTGTGAPVLTPPQPRIVASPPGVLGTIPKDQAVTTPRGPSVVPNAPPNPAAPPAQSASAAPLPQGTPEQQYDQALGLMLQKQDFATAETALRRFIDDHPKNDLTGNAYYWLGETHYVRKNYQDAAFTFAEGFQKFPKGTKAPDSLLKLGMALAQLDKVKEACTAYARLLSNFPKANARLKARVQREQDRSNCR
jgi:tol-pal system protein YbgF